MTSSASSGIWPWDWALYGLSRLLVGELGLSALPVGMALLALFLVLVFLVDGRFLIRRRRV